MGLVPAWIIPRTAVSRDLVLRSPQVSVTTHTSYPDSSAWMAERATQKSVHSPATTNVCLPLLLRSLNTLLCSQTLIVLHSIGRPFGNIIWSWGRKGPPKLFVPAVVSMVRMPSDLSFRPKTKVFSIKVFTSMEPTVERRCFWKSIRIAAELKGVSLF